MILETTEQDYAALIAGNAPGQRTAALRRSLRDQQDRTRPTGGHIAGEQDSGLVAQLVGHQRREPRPLRGGGGLVELTAGAAFLTAG